MQNYLSLLPSICKKWVENPNDIQIELQENDHKAIALIGFLEEGYADEWAVLDFSNVDEVLTEEILLQFFSQLPTDKTFKTKVIFTQKGFTEKAGILAAQNRTWISFFDTPRPENPYYGYRIAVLNRQQILHDNYELSPSDWNKVHDLLYKSELNYWRERPEDNPVWIYNPNKEKVCTWADLIFGLALEKLDTHQDYTFSFPGHRLKVGNFDIPIKGIRFNYFTQLRKIDKTDVSEALDELLATYVFY